MADKPLLSEDDLEPLDPSELLAPGKKSKYPEPKSFHQTDEELKLSSGLQGPEDTFGNYVPPSPLEQQLKGKHEGDIEFLKEISPWLVGGAVGKAAGGAVGKVALKAGEKFGEMSGKAIANTAEHAMHGGVLGYLAGSAAHHPIIGSIVGLAAKPVLDVAARYAPDVIAPVASAAVKSALPVAAAVGTEKVSRGVMSNAIERLRASPLTNVRAQELMTKIDALKNAGTGAVTQSTLGAVNE